MGLFRTLKHKLEEASRGSESSAPPAWAPAPEISHKYGKWNEAPEDEYSAAEDFCSTYPPDAPKLLPSAAVDAINSLGCHAWGIEKPISPRFVGSITNARDTDSKASGSVGVCKVKTDEKCKDVCLLSDLPILAGLYEVDTRTKKGVYYEVKILKMDGVIAIGTACRPYPAWRLPGWNRLSAGLHLDDFRKFFEDPDGGRDYIESGTSPLTQISPHDTLGVGLTSTGTLFFTYNGLRLTDAFTGIYLPREQYDVFAAVGVEGACEFEINFGADLFDWKEGNEWAWRVEGSIGRLGGGSGGSGEELPRYEA